MRTITVQGVTRKLGWHRDRPHRVRQHFSASYSAMRALPPADNHLVSRMSEFVRKDTGELALPFDQGPLGSCTFNWYAAAALFAHHVGNKPLGFTPSRLGGYYGEREREGTTDSDAGAEPIDGVKTMEEDGLGPEDMTGDPANWPYDVDRFTEKPPRAFYTFAKDHQALIESDVEQSLCQIKAAIMQGLPVGFGFNVFESFMSDEVANTGIVPMPGPDEENVGGHMTGALAFDDLGAGNGGFAPIPRCIVGLNSWGGSWGGKLVIAGVTYPGLFFMPYEYILSREQASDHRVIQLTE